MSSQAKCYIINMLSIISINNNLTGQHGSNKTAATINETRPHYKTIGTVQEAPSDNLLAQYTTPYKRRHYTRVRKISYGKTGMKATKKKKKHKENELVERSVLRTAA